MVVELIVGNMVLTYMDYLLDNIERNVNCTNLSATLANFLRSRFDISNKFSVLNISYVISI